MATGNPFFGKVRGKVGGVVLRVERGKQIVSEYNPQKSGDASQKQINQRTKMALANAVSRVFPFPAIVGWDVAPAAARRKFVGSLIDITTLTPVGDARVEAEIDISKIKLSKGVPVTMVSSQLSKVIGAKTEIDATCVWSDTAQVVGYIFTILVYNTTTSQYERVGYTTSTSTSGRARVTISEDVLLSGYKMFCYAVPMIVNTLAKHIVYSQAILDPSTGCFTAETLVEFKRADILGGTQYLGEVDY